MLNGQTERGQAIQMVLYDGKLHSFETEVAVWCPSHRTWTTWTWFPSDGLPVDFKHDGSRFYVREESEQPDAKPPAELHGVMRGELGDDGRSATGRSWRARPGERGRARPRAART